MSDPITTERERRHWTIAKWQDEYGDSEWPSASAQVQMEADHAVDVLQAEVERLRRQREALREAAEEVLSQELAQDMSDETVIVSYAAYRKLDAVLGETEAE